MKYQLLFWRDTLTSFFMIGAEEKLKGNRLVELNGLI
jgi:hypothetical protein